MTSVNCGFSDPDELHQFGPTVHVEVGFDQAFKPGTSATPALPPDRWLGLIDTGALVCCIDSVLAEQLGLPIVDRGLISGVGGTTEVNYHLAQVRIPALGFTTYGTFPGVHLAAGGQQHKVLIGRNLLSQFKMEYDGRTGAVLITQ